MFQILTAVRELERMNKNILHFELGDPDFATPPNIIESAVKSLREGQTHYAPSGGIRELKEAAAEVTLRSRGFKPALDQLLVCPGANVMIYYAACCALDPGDEVIVPDPGFVSYYSILEFLGMKSVRVPLYEENEFRLNPDDVRKRITKNTRMIIINSPSNPTGAVMTEEEIRVMYEIAQEHDIYLVSDEVYARMIYSAGNDKHSLAARKFLRSKEDMTRPKAGEFSCEEAQTKHYSPSQYDHCQKRCIIINGFSKSYAMTGWRLGVMTGPSEIISKMTLLLETTTSCVSPFIQKAGVEALRGDQGQIIRMIDEYKKRRDVMVDGLNSLPGVKCLRPKGAFYVFPHIKQTRMTSEEFTDFMLKEAGVAIVPGSVFGENGEGYVRLCYANSLEDIQKGIDRMKAAFKKKSLAGV